MVRTFKTTCLNLLVFETYSRINKSKRGNKKQEEKTWWAHWQSAQRGESQHDDKQQPLQGLWRAHCADAVIKHVKQFAILIHTDLKANHSC